MLLIVKRGKRLFYPFSAEGLGRLIAAKQQHREDLQRLKDLQPINDDFMRCHFTLLDSVFNFVSMPFQLIPESTKPCKCWIS